MSCSNSLNVEMLIYADKQKRGSGSVLIYKGEATRQELPEKSAKAEADINIKGMTPHLCDGIVCNCLLSDNDLNSRVNRVTCWNSKLYFTMSYFKSSSEK